MSHPGEDLSAYISGELDPEERRKVEQHLSECAECSREYGRLRQLNELLQNARPMEPSRRFLQQVTERVDRDKKVIAFRTKKAVALLALAAAIAFFALLFSMQVAKEPAPPVVKQPPKIEPKEVTQPEKPQQPPVKEALAPALNQKELSKEEAELIAHLDALENMELIENYDNLQHLEMALFLSGNEEVK